MRNLLSKYPFQIVSQFQGPPILNMAGDDEKEEDKDSGVKPEDKEPDDPDAPDPETPAGKKFADMRAEKKELKSQLEVEKEARIKAEARAEAFDEMKAQFGNEGGPAPEESEPEEVPMVVHPDDEKAVLAVLKSQGIDPAQIKKDNEELAAQNRKIASETAIRHACDDLEKEFADSVPFEGEKVIAYAREEKMGLAMPNTPLVDVLRFAYERMNSDAIMDWKIAQRDPKKKAPSLESSGTPEVKSTGEKKDEVDGDDVSDYRKAAEEIKKELIESGT